MTESHASDIVAANDGGAPPDESPLVARLARGIWRVPRLLLIGLVAFYQRAVSPYFGPGRCRYSPTCSSYAIQSLREYGAVRGTILSIWRILRCNPFGGHGYDPPRWFGEPKPTATDSEPDGNTAP